MHMCIIESLNQDISLDNGLLPDRLQAIIRTNDGLLLIAPLRASFSEIWIEM